MIYNITHDRDGRLIQRLAVDVKLAIGLPPDPAKGRKAPSKLDQFIFLRKPEDAKQGTDWKIDDELTKHYGPKPREVDIIFLSDDIEEVFPTQLAWWKASHCVCYGDGQTATRRTTENPEGIAWTPCGDTCEDFKRGDCKPSGDLRFTLAHFPQLGSVARIHTSSYRSIMQINSALHQVQTITGGRLAGIRAKLVVRPEKTSYTDPRDQKRHSTTIFALSIEIQATGMNKLIENMTATARLFEQTRKALGTGHVQVVEEESGRASELEQEFYRHDDGETPEQPRRSVLRDIGPIDIPAVEDKPFPSVKCDECKAEGGHLPSCSKRKNGASPKLDEQAQPERKPEVAMCSECRQIGKHAADCKYAPHPEVKAEPQPELEATVEAPKLNGSLYLIKEVAKKAQKDSKKPYLVLTVIGKDSTGADAEGKLYVWAEHLHGHLLDQKGKMLIGQVTKQETKDKKVFFQLEHIFELGGLKFVNDKPVSNQPTGDELF